MAVGTFYNYYSSKEKLFLDLFLEENRNLKRKILNSIDPDGEPLALIKQCLNSNITGMNENPILREWYNKDVFQKIEQQYRKDNGNQTVDFVFDSVSGFIEKWQSEGKLRRDIDSEMVMAMFGAIINMDTHKDEIGFKYFPRILDYMVDFVLKGLLN